VTKSHVKKIIACTLFVGGVVGAILSAFKLIAAHEPPLVVQLSWAAFWTTGVVGLIAADDPGLSDADVERIATAVRDAS
jgi:hypothetical protein